jgi:hypothetical protein
MHGPLHYNELVSWGTILDPLEKLSSDALTHLEVKTVRHHDKQNLGFSCFGLSDLRCHRQQQQQHPDHFRTHRITFPI